MRTTNWRREMQTIIYVISALLFTSGYTHAAKAEQSRMDNSMAVDSTRAMAGGEAWLQSDQEAFELGNDTSQDADELRDRRGNSGLTAGQQSGSESDVEITRNIRRAITQEDDLSTYALNVTIITRDGEVSLIGPVRSEAEKQLIENIASQVAGEGRLKSEITITAE